MWKEVFKSGTHTDSSGNTHTYSDGDLQTIADKYNSQTEHKAPVVIGHPVTDSPAYGWVQSLKFENGSLYADIVQTDPQFEEMVNNGRYKMVSIALYDDGLLRHVGYLGAIPPAVKGLKPANFSESKYSVFSTNQTKNFKKNNFIESQFMDTNLTSLFTDLLKFLGDTFNTEVENQTSAKIDELVAKYNIGQITAQKQPASQTPPADGSQPPAGNSDQSTQNNEQFNELKQQLEVLRKENEDSKFDKFFSELIHTGYALPAQKEFVKNIYTTTKENKEEYVKKFIGSFGKQIEFGEQSNGQNHRQGKSKLEVNEAIVAEFEKGKA